MKNFEAIIFDMDGLLLDSEIMGFNAFKKTCKQFELGNRDDLYFQCIGANSEATKRILSTGLAGAVEFDIFWKICRDSYHQDIATNGTPLKKGAQELLSHIQSLQIPLAVATSTTTDIAKTKLDNAGIINFFTKIIGGDQVSNSKPLPDIYLKAVSELGVNASHCIALEDSENGVISATAAGLSVIQIPDLIAPSETLRKNGHIILDSLNDVINFNFDSIS